MYDENIGPPQSSLALVSLWGRNCESRLVIACLTAIFVLLLSLCPRTMGAGIEVHHTRALLTSLCSQSGFRLWDSGSITWTVHKFLFQRKCILSVHYTLWPEARLRYLWAHLSNWTHHSRRKSDHKNYVNRTPMLLLPFGTVYSYRGVRPGLFRYSRSVLASGVGLRLRP